MLKIILIATSLLFVNVLFAQSKADKELFKGEQVLSSCFHNIPLTYKKKDDLITASKAKELEGKELVLLKFNKKDKSITVERYYLFTELKDREIFNFLIAKKDHIQNKRVLVFLKFTPKFDRFYEAECFDEILKQNPEIQNQIHSK
jgi:hypothetical protein